MCGFQYYLRNHGHADIKLFENPALHGFHSMFDWEMKLTNVHCYFYMRDVWESGLLWHIWLSMTIHEYYYQDKWNYNKQLTWHCLRLLKYYECGCGNTGLAYTILQGAHRVVYTSKRCLSHNITHWVGCELNWECSGMVNSLVLIVRSLLDLFR